MRSRLALFLVVAIVQLLVLQVWAEGPVVGPRHELYWQSPSTNTDATSLTDLGGFVLRYSFVSANACTATDADLGLLSAAPGATVGVRLGNPILDLATATGQQYAILVAYNIPNVRSACSAILPFFYVDEGPISVSSRPVNDVRPSAPERPTPFSRPPTLTR